MAASSAPRPWRALIALLVATVALGTWAFWPGQDHAPRLGLDLQGGTQVILVPKLASGSGSVSQDQLNQTVEIIRQRVNGFGVSEADVTTQGSGGSSAIVVSVPGVNQQRIAELLKQTALLDFRPVEAEQAAAPPTPEPSAGTPNPTPDSNSSPSAKPKSKAVADPAQSATSSAGRGQSAPIRAPAAPAKPTAKPKPSPSPSASPDVQRPPIQSPTNNTALQQAFLTLDCSDPLNRQGGTPDDPAQWIVTCSKDGGAKYLLQPAFIRGTQITDAQAQLPQNGAGGWQVTLSFNTEGAKQLAEVSTKLYQKSPPQNQFAIVLDGLVQSSPYFSEPILGGNAEINGSFTVQEARDLANILRYGALPVNLDIAEVTSVSPTLGADQLQAGLLAGALGLALVFLYLLLYYRGLGVVAVVSLAVAAALTYFIFVILGRQLGLALTLAGVAGAIVAIGITADSFVVFFERIRDEIRDGKSLRVAIETGWKRARNTILAADFVSVLAAAILYFLSIGSVRGFAFVLGLTTIIDVIVAFMFTKPVMTLLARTRLFASGHPMTGLDPRRLGVGSPPYRPQRGARKKRSKAALDDGQVPPDEADLPEPAGHTSKSGAGA